MGNRLNIRQSAISSRQLDRKGCSDGKKWKDENEIGIIGCGVISGAYFDGAAEKTDILDIKACADLRIEAAQAQAETYNCEALTVDALLADDEIELVVNLTIPRAHVDVGLQVLEAGKHVYSEKPLGVDTCEREATD